MAKNGKIAEELYQKGYVQKDGTCKGKDFNEAPNLEFYNLGATTFKQLQDANIFSRLNLADGQNKLRPDAFIKMNGDNSRAIAIIEYKKSGELNSKKKEDEALEQTWEYCQITGAKIGVLTDGAKFLWINGLSDKKKIQRIKHDDGHDLNLQFELNEALPISTLTIIERLDQDLTKTNSRLSKIKTVNPINLANKTWQTIWITKKTTPKKSLLTFVEFFMFKFLSDIGVLTGQHSFGHLAGLDPEDQLEHYINTVRKHIKKMFPEAHHGAGHFKDDTTTIINGFPLNSNIAGDIKTFSQIVRDLAPHSLKNLDPEFKSHLYEIFMKDDRNSLNQMGQFFTPRSIIRTMVKMSEIEQLPDGSRVCDPACGVGGFLLEPLIELRKNEFAKDPSGKIKSKITYHGFDVRDSQEDLLTTILAKANFVIHTSDAIQANSKKTSDFADIMNEMFKCYTEDNTGSLSELYPEHYQLVLSNPPYVSSGSASIKEQVNWSQVSSQGLEGMFLEKICRELAPNGRAFVVLPDGIFFRDADKPLREYLFRNCQIEGIVSLPVNAFFNTTKKTNILIIRKLNKNEKLGKYKVFGFFVKDIGESLDADRLPTDLNDLPDLEREFRIFTALSRAGISKDYKPQSNKVVMFDSESFKDGSGQGWNIDRRITDEEKEKMGFEVKRVAEITYDQFKTELIKTAEEISSIAKETLLTNNLTVKPKHKTTKVKAHQLFDLKKGSGSGKLTDAFINQNKGDVPVYGSFNDPTKVKGFIQDKLSKINYYQDEIRINTNGASAGMIFFTKGRFAISGDVRVFPIQPQFKNQLDKDFLKFIFERETSRIGFNWSFKAGLGKLKEVEFEIPVDENGNFDLVAQQEIAQEYLKLTELKKTLTEKLNSLIEKKVVF